MGRCVNKRRAKSDAACDSVTLHRALRSPPVPRVTQERAPELHDDSKGVIARRAQCTRDTHRVGSRDSSLRWRPPVPVAMQRQRSSGFSSSSSPQSPECRVERIAWVRVLLVALVSLRGAWEARTANKELRARVWSTGGTGDGGWETQTQTTTTEGRPETNDKRRALPRHNAQTQTALSVSDSDSVFECSNALVQWWDSMYSI